MSSSLIRPLELFGDKRPSSRQGSRSGPLGSNVLRVGSWWGSGRRSVVIAGLT